MAHLRFRRIDPASGFPHATNRPQGNGNPNCPERALPHDGVENEEGFYTRRAAAASNRRIFFALGRFPSAPLLLDRPTLSSQIFLAAGGETGRIRLFRRICS